MQDSAVMPALANLNEGSSIQDQSMALPEYKDFADYQAYQE